MVEKINKKGNYGGGIVDNRDIPEAGTSESSENMTLSLAM